MLISRSVFAFVLSSSFLILPVIASASVHHHAIVTNEDSSIFDASHTADILPRASRHSRNRAAQRKAAQRAAARRAKQKAAAEKNKGSQPSSSAPSGQNVGEGTFYQTGLGACGWWNKNTDYIAAASELLYDGFEGGAENPNNNPICGRMVQANYKGKTVRVKIVDRCIGCAKFDLDFSPSAFGQLADHDVGRLRGMTWTFV